MCSTEHWESHVHSQEVNGTNTTYTTGLLAWSAWQKHNEAASLTRVAVGGRSPDAGQHGNWTPPQHVDSTSFIADGNVSLTSRTSTSLF